MVVSPGIGKAATTVADKATTTTAKTASKEQVGRFDAAMAKPDQGGAAASSAAGPANQSVAAAGNAAPAGGGPPATSTEAAKSVRGGGPGDRILRGIDSMRSTAQHLVNGAPSAPGAEGASPLGNVSELMDTQKSMIGFEVETQVGGKGVQETNQTVQTLLKGQ